ncbi:MAG: hypothetical protein NXI22_07475 [bacterium]|nr:hypothetical protein [bacterium]
MTQRHSSAETEAAIAENKRRKRRTKLSYWLMAGAMTVGVVLCIAMAYFIWRAKKLTEVAAMEADIRQRGEPLTHEELNAYYHGDGGGKDKSALFVKLIPKLTDETFAQDQLDYDTAQIHFENENEDEPPERLTDKWLTRPDAEAFLLKHVDLIEEIESAALAEGDVRHLTEYTSDWNEVPDHFYGLREASRLYHTRIDVAAHNGDWDTVYRSIRVQYQLGEVLRYDVGVAQATRAALRNMAHWSAQRWLPVADFSDDQLRQLKQDCQTVDWQTAHERRLFGDRALGRATFANPNIHGADYAKHLATPNAEDLRFYLEHMNQRIAATKLPPAKFWAEYDRLIAELDDESTYLSKLHGLSRQIVPRVGGIGTIRGAAFDRITATQIAIELYRRKHDQFPQDLEDLVPEYLEKVPTDPFAGTPLQYRVDAAHVVVYSVGLDRTDNGGEVLENPIIPDLVVAVKRREKQK